MKKLFQVTLLIINYQLLISEASAQQRPFGHENAIHKDSSIFIAWATQGTVQRGYQSIANPSLGATTVGDETSIIGKAGENGVVSLGDGGYAILQFDKPIRNGAGEDFAVFENGFFVAGDTTIFMELAFVEVSSDGNRYVRFPSVSHISVNRQIQDGEGTSPNLVHNLAGKYVALWGTPFDLEDLKDSAGINLQAVTHVKIVDVIGSLDNRFAMYDVLGRKVNDPFPTPFASGGFDLDAVGVINQSTAPTSVKENTALNKIILPSNIDVNTNYEIKKLPLGATLRVIDLQGKLVLEQTILQENLTIQAGTFLQGLYVIEVMKEGNFVYKKILAH